MISKSTLQLGLGLAAIGILAACQPKVAAPIDTAKAAEDIKATMGAAIDAFNAHDAEKAVAPDLDDYVGMMHGTPNLMGKAADLAFNKQLVADPATKIDVVDNVVDVAKAGDMGVQRITYAYTYTDPKSKAPTTEHGNWVLGWKAQADGSWKLAWSVISDMPAPK